MKSKQKRIVFMVKWDTKSKRWKVSVIHFFSEVDYVPTKKDAIELAVSCARREWESFGRFTQVVIHGKDGKIQREYTYGKDPKRSRG